MFLELIHVGLAIGLAATIAVDKPNGKSLTVTDKPLTVKVEPTAELRAGLAAAAAPVPKVTVTLVLEGIATPKRREEVEGVLIFLNKDDANAETPADDPHFVTAFSFPPGPSDPYGLNVDLTRTVRALGRRGQLDPAKPLRVTLVAVPSRGGKELPAGVSVPIGRLSIEAVPAK